MTCCCTITARVLMMRAMRGLASFTFAAGRQRHAPRCTSDSRCVPCARRPTQAVCQISRGRRAGAAMRNLEALRAQLLGWRWERCESGELELLWCSAPSAATLLHAQEGPDTGTLGGCRWAAAPAALLGSDDVLAQVLAERMRCGSEPPVRCIMITWKPTVRAATGTGCDRSWW